MPIVYKVIIFCIFFTVLSLKAEQNVSDDIKLISNLYNEVLINSNQLKQENLNFCENISSKSLLVLRSKFHYALNAWMKIQHIRFGPIQDFNTHSRIQFWPDKHAVSIRQLNKIIKQKNLESLDPNNFTFKSVAIQGFPTLETILYTKHEDLLKGDKSQYLCDLTSSIIINIITLIEDTLKIWEKDTSWQSYVSQTDLPVIVLGSIATQLNFINKYKILRPLGKTISKSNIKKLESWRSGRSLTNIIINLESLQNHYEVFLENNLKEHSFKVNQEIKVHFQQAIKILKNLDMPLYKGIKFENYREQLLLVSNEIFMLHEIFHTKAPAILNVTLGFNSLDGD